MYKKISALFLIIMIAMTLGCSSKYDKLMDKYENIYNETVDFIDIEKVHESINTERVSSNMKQLDNLFVEIQEEIPDDDLTKYIALKGKHELLKAVIENGKKWEDMQEVDKLVLKKQINILKSSNE